MRIKQDNEWKKGFVNHPKPYIKGFDKRAQERCEVNITSISGIAMETVKPWQAFRCFCMILEIFFKAQDES